MATQALKGIGEAVPAWQVAGVHAALTRFQATRDPGGSHFVGRDAELALLLDRWRSAAAGEGQVLLMSGEPGIGKSRLCETFFGRIADQPHDEVRLQCSPYHANSPLYPILRHLERAAGFADEDAPAARLDKFSRLFAGAMERPEAAVLAQALGLSDAPVSPAPIAGRQAPMLALLLGLLLRTAAARSLSVLVEDAHWVDPTTQELLGLLIDRIEDRPVLLAITHRPEFAPAWGTPAHLTRLSMNRLDTRHCNLLVGEIAGGKSLPDEVMRQILAKGDGVPLFVEELTRATLDSGILVEEADAWRANGKLPPLAVPSSLQDSVMARLDRIAPARDIAEAAAAIGREFSARLLSHVLGMTEPALDAALAKLVEAGLLVSRGPGGTCAFKHALTRDAAYACMLNSRRKIVHGRIATALGELDDGIARTTEPELLAYHFQEAGDASAALPLWIAAGDLAERRGAAQEAVAHFRRALDLTGAEGMAAGSRECVPAIGMKLGNALIQAEGYGSASGLKSYQDARQSATTMGLPEQAARAAIGMAPSLFASCRYRDVIEIGTEILEAQPDRLAPTTLVQLRLMLGIARHYLGDFKLALEQLEMAIDLDNEVNCTQANPFAGADPAIVARDYASFTLRFLGFIKKSHAWCEESVQIAEERGHAYSMAWAKHLLARSLQFAGCYTESLVATDEAISICERNGFVAIMGVTLRARGASQFHLGQHEQGLREVRRGIDIWGKTCNKLALTSRICGLVELQVRAHQIDEAIANLCEAEQVSEASDEKHLLAEISRLRGRIWLLRGNFESARTCYERAIAWAKEREARLFELRATRDLACLAVAEGNPDPALARLRAIVDWFPPTLDIPDLIESRRLLSEAANREPDHTLPRVIPGVATVMVGEGRPSTISRFGGRKTWMLGLRRA